MKYSTINKKVISTQEQEATILSKVSDFFIKSFLITLGIICIPLILVAWLAMLISNALQSKGQQPSQDGWFGLNTPSDIPLLYKSLDATSISDAAASYFDIEQLTLYKAEPAIEFFNGYFTSFRVQRNDGIFVQKVYFDKNLEEILSMPLYFFNYQTKEVEEIHYDLKDYTLDTKGSANDFLLTASGEHQDLEIRIIKSYS
ncbi:MAG: hypothetical protein ACRYFZ_24230 [Janthinobacterium lividum]